MRTLRNEQGYTLLIVLLTITLMFPIAIFLITSNVNSSKQLQSTESHNSSIALAEMGITRVRAEIEHALETIDIDYIIDGISVPINEEEIAKQVNQKVAQAIAERISEKRIELEENASYVINIEAGNPEEDRMVFHVTSVGQSAVEYEITADIVVMTTVVGGASEEESTEDDSTGGGGIEGGTSGNFDDPSGFVDWTVVGSEIAASIVAPEIPTGNRPGGTFSGTNVFDAVGFSSAVTLNPETSFTVNGGMLVTNSFTATNTSEIFVRDAAEIRGAVTINSVPRFDIGSHFRITTGTSRLTNSALHIGGSAHLSATTVVDASTLTVGGGFHNTSSTTLTNGSTFIVDGDMAMNSSINIQNSSATFNGYTALNTLTIAGMTERIRTRNLHVGQLDVSNSELLIGGSLRLSTGSSTIGTNSTVTVQGHLLTWNRITMDANSTLIVYGDAEFRNIQNTLSFNGNSARFIIFGEAINYADNIWNAITREVDTVDQCTVSSNTNMVCFVNGEPPTDGNGQGGGSGDNGQDGDNNGSGGGIDFKWGPELKLQNVEYLGRIKK